MHVYLRPVRFEDVDAAQIVFFARFFGYCHEAMERLFDDLAGGYVSLVRDRKIGFPAVHVECDFKHPLRYGDVARIVTTVAKVGHKSCTFHYEFSRAADGLAIASARHVCVVSDLVHVTGLAIPDDVRRVLEAHADVEADEASPLSRT